MLKEIKDLIFLNMKLWGLIQCGSCNKSPVETEPELLIHLYSRYFWCLLFVLQWITLHHKTVFIPCKFTPSSFWENWIHIIMHKEKKQQNTNSFTRFTDSSFTLLTSHFMTFNLAKGEMKLVCMEISLNVYFLNIWSPVKTKTEMLRIQSKPTCRRKLCQIIV